MADKGTSHLHPIATTNQASALATYWHLHERYQDYRYRMFLGLRVLLTDLDSPPRPR